MLMPKRRYMDIPELLFQEDAIPNLRPKTRPETAGPEGLEETRGEVASD